MEGRPPHDHRARVVDPNNAVCYPSACLHLLLSLLMGYERDRPSTPRIPVGRYRHRLGWLLQDRLAHCMRTQGAWQPIVCAGLNQTPLGRCCPRSWNARSPPCSTPPSTSRWAMAHLHFFGQTRGCPMGPSPKPPPTSSRPSVGGALAGRSRTHCAIDVGSRTS